MAGECQKWSRFENAITAALSAVLPLKNANVFDILILMEYPPWLPKPELSRNGMLLALARYVHEEWYRPEVHLLKGEIRTFDNMCSSDLECISSILNKAGFTRYLDDIGRRSVFNCEPDEFEDIANAVSAERLPKSAIEESIIRLAKGNYGINLEIEWLAMKLVADE